MRGSTIVGLVLAILLALLPLAPSTSAAALEVPPFGTCTTTFTGTGVGASWHEGTNWSGGEVPDASDRACISTDGADVALDAPATVEALLVDVGTTLVLHGARLEATETIDNRGRMTIAAPVQSSIATPNLENRGRLHLEVDLQLEGGTSTTRNTGNLTTGDGAELTVFGRLIHEAGTLSRHVRFEDGALFEYRGGNLDGPFIIPSWTGILFQPVPNVPVEDVILVEMHPLTTVGGDVPAGVTLRIRSGLHAPTTFLDGFTNYGTIELLADGPSGGLMRVTEEGRFTNAGTIRVPDVPLDAEHRPFAVIDGELRNTGQIELERDLRLHSSGVTHRNLGTITAHTGAQFRVAPFHEAVFLQMAGALTSRTLAEEETTFVYEGGTIAEDGSAVRIAGHSTLQFANDLQVPAGTTPRFALDPLARLGSDIAEGAIVRARGGTSSPVSARMGITNYGTLELLADDGLPGHIQVDLDGPLHNQGVLRVPRVSEVEQGPAGQLSGALVNHGQVDLERDLSLTASGVVHRNLGSIDVSPDALLRLNPFHAAEFIQEDGSLSSRLHAFEGATLEYAGGAIGSPGAVRIGGGATLRFAPDAEVPDGTTAAFDLAPITRFTGDVPAGAVVRASGGASSPTTVPAGVTNLGTVELVGTGSSGGVLQVDGGGRFTNAGTLRVPPAEPSHQAWLDGALLNEGTLSLSRELRLFGDLVGLAESGTLSGGSYHLGADLLLREGSPTIESNGSNLTLAGGTFRRDGQDALHTLVDNQGVLLLVAGDQQVAAGFTNGRTVGIAPGAQLLAGAGGTGTYTEARAPGAHGTNLAGELAASTVEVDPGGRFAGTGTVAGSLRNGGLVVAGDPTSGQLTVEGGYTQTANGSLAASIAVADGGPRLVVRDAAVLDGSIAVRRAGEVALDEPYLVIEAGSRTGTFGSVDEIAQDAPAGFEPRAIYGSTDGDPGRATVSVVLEDVAPPTLEGELAFGEIGTDRFTVVWPTASDNDRVAGYRVEVTAGGQTVAERVLGVAAEHTTFAGLEPATEHVVRVRAIDRSGLESAPLEGTTVTLREADDDGGSDDDGSDDGTDGGSDDGSDDGADDDGSDDGSDDDGVDDGSDDGSADDGSDDGSDDGGDDGSDDGEAVEAAFGDVPAGGSLSTGGSPTTTIPVVTRVTSPSGGSISIDQGVATIAATGYDMLQYAVDIVAPPESSTTSPIVLRFRLDRADLPAGPITIFRNGEVVEHCDGPDGVAAPDPCFTARAVDGLIELTVLTTRASRWTFGVAVAEEPGTSGACDGAPRSAFRDATGVHGPAIHCLAWWGITEGLDAGRFGTGDRVTRAQTASFLARLIRASGAELPEGPSAFRDVAGVHARNIDALARAGIVRGVGDREFAPNRPVTRGQIATMLVGTVRYITGEELPVAQDWFRDDDGSVHERAINAARTAGMLRGRADGTFGSDLPATRGQMASFLTGLLDRLVADGVAAPPTHGSS